MTRREFLIGVVYGAFCLPVISIFGKLIKGTIHQAKIKPHPARYYQELAG